MISNSIYTFVIRPGVPKAFIKTGNVRINANPKGRLAAAFSILFQ
jgi:hypothetical protein